MPGMGRQLTGDNGQELFKEGYFKCKVLYVLALINARWYIPNITDIENKGRKLFYTSDIVHRDEEGDYQIYGRVCDAIRYRGELLNLPVIEGAAVRACIEKSV